MESGVGWASSYSEQLESIRLFWVQINCLSGNYVLGYFFMYILIYIESFYSICKIAKNIHKIHLHSSDIICITKRWFYADPI